jgi:hypothetical protein
MCLLFVFVSSHYFIIVDLFLHFVFFSLLLLERCKVVFHFFIFNVFLLLFACSLFYCCYSFLFSFSASFFVTRDVFFFIVGIL